MGDGNVLSSDDVDDVDKCFWIITSQLATNMGWFILTDTHKLNTNSICLLDILNNLLESDESQ